MKQGIFIVFEGLDGSGLTTHAVLLQKWFKDKGFEKVHLTKEPTEGPIGLLIRQILKELVYIPKDPIILTLLFAADRIYHLYYEPYGPIDRMRIGQIGLRKALSEGYIVISDRYVYSSYAFQTVPVGDISVDLKWVQEVNRYIIKPDLVIFLDVPPEVCLSRIAIERWRYQLFENYPDLKSVYERFKKILLMLKNEGERIVLIPQIKENGNIRQVDEVQNDIRSEVQKLLEERGVKENG
jgi:dTMP kinase